MKPLFLLENEMSLVLLTDLYQLTMAYGYWKEGRSEQSAVFHLYYRTNPFKGGYVIAAGLQPVVEVLKTFQFEADDLAYLATINGNDGQPLFESAFLEYLRRLELSVDVDAIAEGTVVFQNEPLLRIKGPILQCQLLETILLNIVNFQSLIATKASRIVRAAQGDDVLEFGLRRAQGVDGALAASRAAYIGGCTATSNVLAGKLMGIPVRGTHAHSWVMSFESEPEAFRAYARAMPNNCVFLVDTYDTLRGVQHAIEAGHELRKHGHRMVGIRLDSGDLAALSIEARRMLDQAGFVDAKIVASNDLDERLIQSLKQQNASICVWGVGTKLVTAYDQPALGGVYKLGAIQDKVGHWRPTMKISEQIVKTSNPGVLQVRRFFDDQRHAVGDMICNELQSNTHPTANESAVIVDPVNPLRSHTLPSGTTSEELLQPAFRGGTAVVQLPSLQEVRSRTFQQMSQFSERIFRFDNPQEYPVGLSKQLFDLKVSMMQRKK